MWSKTEKCHMEGGGKELKKCHVLFEWFEPNIQTWFTSSKIKPTNWQVSCYLFLVRNTGA